MTPVLIITCHKCGGLLLAKTGQKTRTCPYCGSTVYLDKSRKVASAPNANEAATILRRLKRDAFLKRES